MGTIKKYNNTLKQWEVVATSDASSIAVRSEQLLPENLLESNVELTLIDLKEDIATLQGNVKWLALHGGGGSGGGSGSGTIQALIMINGISTGSLIIFEDNVGLVITVLSTDTNLKWDILAINASSGLLTIKSITKASQLLITKDDLEKANIFKTFTLSVSAYNSDTLTTTYWNGDIFLSTVYIETADEVSYPLLETANKELTYNYNIGVVGVYKLLINDLSLWEGSLLTLTGSINILIDDLKNAGILGAGANQIKSLLISSENDNIRSNIYNSSIVLTTDKPIINCPSLSTDSNNPTTIYVNAGDTVVLTPHTVYYDESTYKSIIYTGEKKDIDWETIAEYKSYNTTYADSSVVISAKADEDLKIQIHILNQSGAKEEYWETFYIRTANPTFTLLDNGLSEKCVFNYITYNGVIDSNRLWKDNKDNILTIINSNYYSSNIEAINRSLRLQNRSFAIVNNSNDSYYNILIAATLVEFTLSLCYKCDFHPDDDRTILQFGTNASDWSVSRGILIKDHKLHIGTNTLDLQDRELTTITITYKQESSNSKNGKAFVYIDGVVEAIFDVSVETIIPKNTPIYLGVAELDGEYAQYTDFNLYRVSLYRSCFNPYEVLCDYLNDLAYTHLLNGLPNSEYISEGIQRNIIEQKDDTFNPIIWNTSLSFDNNNTNFENNFDLSKIVTVVNNKISFRDDINSASFSIPIPMMLIDVSAGSDWTWKSFTTPNIKLSLVDNCPFLYFDLKGSFTGTLEGFVSVSLQGTSTMANYIKNLSITFNDDTVFIPKETWFPEKTYTLKADIVDSSHALNASIGKFINEELGFKYDENGELINTDSWYPFSEIVASTFAIEKHKKESATLKYFPKATLKHGVEGFPVFLVMRFGTNETSTREVATIGIYQFILGRDSARNLGYETVANVSGMDLGISYPYYKEGVTLETTKIPGYWIEFFLNDPFADDIKFQSRDTLDGLKLIGPFWQQDIGGSYYNKAASIEYTSLGSEAASVVTDIEPFTKFVENILLLPVLIRRYSSQGSPNLLRHVISNSIYDKYSCEYDSKNKTFLWSKVEGSQNIIAAKGDPVESLISNINIESISKYFVIGMFLGMIDNFMKNMPLKFYRNGNTWEPPILGIYDADTSCGGDNLGNLKVSESVWLSPLKNQGTNLLEVPTESETNKIYSIIGSSNKLWYLDTPELNYSYPEAGSESGSIFSGQWNSLLSYLGISELNQLVDLYVDKYFIPQTEGCGELLFNLTYFMKYVQAYSEDKPQYDKLHGRRIKLVRSWLRNRVNFLDSMFTAMGTPKSMPLLIVPTKSTSIGSGSYPEFSITTNYPMIIRTRGQSDDSIQYVFCEDNINTSVYWGAFDPASTTVQHSLSYPESLQKLGSDTLKLANIAYTNIYSGKIPNLIEYDISNCTTLETMNATDMLNTFSKDGVSELRIINASNTAKPSGTSINFVLDLSKGFEKLLELNLYNSCVSELILPSNPNIPLVSVDIRGALITTLTLDQQNLLTSIDLSNCNRLIDLTLTNCEKLNTLSLNASLSSLKNVVVSSNNFSSFSCVNNKSISTVDIKSSNLSNVTITNCTALTTVDIDGSKLSTLNLEGCTKLTTLNITGISDGKIFTDFNIKNCNSLLTIKINGVGTDYTIDLSKIAQFGNFNMLGVSKVKYVLFRNIENSPVVLNNTFNSCTELLRIYGNIEATALGMFDLCTKFSIHGDTISTVKFQGKSVVNNSTGLVYHFTDSLLSGTNFFLSGTGVTNIIINNGYCAFRSTKCTLFDLYYTFWYSTNLLNCYLIFYNCTNAQFTWVNSPNRYLFKNSSKITNLQDAFRNGSKYFRIWSPTNNGINVTADDGLFSPLTNCTNLHYTFWGSYFYIDRFVFRRTNSNYKITDLSGFYIYLCVDNINNLSSDIHSTITTYLNDNYNITGNFSNFFDNLPSATSINGLGIVNQFFNFDLTKDLNIPAYTINAVFISTYGKGDIILSNLFKKDSSGTYLLLNIAHSFLVLNNTYKTTFKITDSLLENFSNLNSWTDNDTGVSYSADYSRNNDCPFCGNGIERTINLNTFPYNILAPCSNILRVCGLFKGVIKNSSLGTITLPGTLFSSTSNLTHASYCFLEFNTSFTLTSGSFENCPNLKDVRYIFASSALTGNIPNKLFWHGGKESELETYIVADLDDGEGGYKYNPLELIELEDGTKILRGVDEEDIITFVKPSYINYNKNIEVMKLAFYGVNTTTYINTNPAIENRKEYTPYTHILNNGIWSVVTKDTISNTCMWEYDGVNLPANYSGENLDDFHDATIMPTIYLPWGEQSGSLYFMCAPDLLRYCTSTVNIDYLFADSGHRSTSSTLNYNSPIGVGSNWGIKGRIPPYLLKSINNVDSIKGMFKNCKLLSYYTTDDVLYVIPKSFFKYTPLLSNLESTFLGLVFPENISLDIFKSGANNKQALNVAYIFYRPYFNGTSSKRAYIGDIFSGMNINTLIYAFGNNGGDNNGESLELLLPYTYKQYVQFDKVFDSRNDGKDTHVFDGYTSGSVLFTNQSLRTDIGYANYRTR